MKAGAFSVNRSVSDGKATGTGQVTEMRTSGQPIGPLQARIDTMASGRTVEIESGTYLGSLVIAIDLTLKAVGGPVRIESRRAPAITVRNGTLRLSGIDCSASGAAAIVLDPGVSAQKRPANTAGLVLESCNLQGSTAALVNRIPGSRLRATNCQFSAGTESVIRLPVDATAIFERVEIRGGRAGVVAQSGARIQFTQASVSHSSGVGIRLGPGSHLFSDGIGRLSVVGHKASGIVIDKGSELTLTKATISDNREWGIDATGSNVQLVGCRLDGNAAGSIRPDASSTGKERSPASAITVSPDHRHNRRDLEVLASIPLDQPALPDLNTSVRSDPSAAGSATSDTTESTLPAGSSSVGVVGASDGWADKGASSPTLADPRFGWVARTIGVIEPGSTTISELLARLTDANGADDAPAHIREYVEDLDAMSIENELHSIVGAICAAAAVPGLIGVLGWDGDPPRSIEQVSALNDDLAESVRTELATLRRSLSSVSIWTPSIDRISTFLGVHSLTSDPDLITILLANGLIESDAWTRERLQALIPLTVPSFDLDAPSVDRASPDIETLNEPAGRDIEGPTIPRRNRRTAPKSEAVFRQVAYTFSELVDLIESGHLGLPELQRPFVWKGDKVRELFESMYEGVPVGSLLLWENPPDAAIKPFGADRQVAPAKLVAVDGQQRLTSIWAAVTGKAIVDAHFQKRTIQIGFNPRTQAFIIGGTRGSDSASVIPDIGLLLSGRSSPDTVFRRYLDAQPPSSPINRAERMVIRASIRRLEAIREYPLGGLLLERSLSVEKVASIFIKINSQGVRLNQSDFALTLMSVHWTEGRQMLERFCREALVDGTGRNTPHNPFISPEPESLLTVTTCLDLRKAHVREARAIIGDRPLGTGRTVTSQSAADRFDRSQHYVLDLDNWHDFFDAIRRAGYVNRSMFSSSAALEYSYALFLIGRRDFKVPLSDLQATIARWFFMANLTSRYTGGKMTRMEQDLALLRPIRSANRFQEVLEKEIVRALPKTFWSTTLPDSLMSTSRTNQGYRAFEAALISIGAQTLYGNSPVSGLHDPDIPNAERNAERIALFSRRHLSSSTKSASDSVMQVANLAVIDRRNAPEDRASGPDHYRRAMTISRPLTSFDQNEAQHALPREWWTLPFEAFLRERRRVMADVVKEAFEGMRS